MSNLNSKSSFSIENILCHNLTKPNGYSSMAGLYTDYSSVPFSNHLQTYPLSHFTNSIDFAPARYYFPQTNPQTLPYIDPFTSTFQKGNKILYLKKFYQYSIFNLQLKNSVMQWNDATALEHRSQFDEFIHEWLRIKVTIPNRANKSAYWK